MATAGVIGTVGGTDVCDVLLAVDSVDKESEHTRKLIKYARGIFETFCEQKKISANATGRGKHEHDFASLDGVIARFYVEARNRDGQLYSKKTMKALRFGLQRHFASLYEIDVSKHPAFLKSNNTYINVLKGLKRAGKGMKHRPQVTPNDMIRIQESLLAKQSTAKGLQQKVYLDIVVHFNDLRASNFRGLRRGDLKCHLEPGTRQKFYTLGSGVSSEHQQKPPEFHEQSRMYSVPGNKKCPVASLERYLAKLNPSSESLWQTPRTKVSDDEAVWYDSVPLGERTLGALMKTISSEADCSRLYTYQSLQASSFSILEEYGSARREIQSPTVCAVEDDEGDYVEDDDGWEMEFCKEGSIDSVARDKAASGSETTPSPLPEYNGFLETFMDSNSKSGHETHVVPERQPCVQTAAYTSTSGLTTNACRELEYFSKDIASSMRRIPEEWWDDVKIGVMTVIRNISVAAARSAAQGASRRTFLSPAAPATIHNSSGPSSLGRPTPGHTCDWIAASTAGGTSQEFQQRGSPITPATYNGTEQVAGDPLPSLHSEDVTSSTLPVCIMRT